MIRAFRSWYLQFRINELRTHIADVERWVDETKVALPEYYADLKILESEKRTMECKRIARYKPRSSFNLTGRRA